MAELTDIEQLILEALKELGASSEDKIKSADDVQKKCNRPKGQVTNALISLVNKGVIFRKAREKSAGYYVINK